MGIFVPCTPFVSFSFCILWAFLYKYTTLVDRQTRQPIPPNGWEQAPGASLWAGQQLNVEHLSCGKSELNEQQSSMMMDGCVLDRRYRNCARHAGWLMNQSAAIGAFPTRSFICHDTDADEMWKEEQKTRMTYFDRHLTLRMLSFIYGNGIIGLHRQKSQPTPFLIFGANRSAGRVWSSGSVLITLW